VAEQDLVEAIPRGGCPACRLLRRAETQYWFFFLYEGFQDPEAGAALRRSIGYCRRHLGQLADHNDVFAAANLALASVGGALERLDASRGRWGKRRVSQPAGAGCPACTHTEATEHAALESLGPLLEKEPTIHDLYRSSAGLCFDHVAKAQRIGVEGLSLLEAHARRRLEEQATDLACLIRSFDYQTESADAQLAGAWKRAFRAIRGDPGRVGGP